MSDDKNLPEAEQVNKIKVGEVEFEQEELDSLVGLGKKYRELEEKQGQPIDDILSSWGRRGETIGEQKKTIEGLESKIKNLETPPPTEEEVDEEKLKAQVLTEAKKFGLITREEVESLANDIYASRRAGETILSKSQRVIKQAIKQGKPEVEVEKLLEFMADPNNPKDPQNAYDIMFKGELKEWEKKQLETIKNKGMTTITNAPANKEPERKVVATKDGLTEALKEHFSNYGQ